MRTESFVMFTAQKEIPVALMEFDSNSLINLFRGVNTIEGFKALDLPIK